MTKHQRIALGLVGALLLSGCIEGVTPYRPGPDAVIATATDRGQDSVGLAQGEAAIAYDPDGCQGWIIDDGLEGYSGRRYDPATGLPVCNSLYPPGTVIGVYQTGDAGINDSIPGHQTDLVYVQNGSTYWTYPQSYVNTNPVDTVPDHE
jgi:hypothetical protein